MYRLNGKVIDSVSVVGWIGHDEDEGTGRAVVDELETFAMGKIIEEMEERKRPSGPGQLVRK